MVYAFKISLLDSTRSMYLLAFYTDAATEGVWEVVDFVDVPVVPEQKTFGEQEPFRYFKIPADTLSGSVGVDEGG